MKTLLRSIAAIGVGYCGREVYVRPSPWAAYVLAVCAVLLAVMYVRETEN